MSEEGERWRGGERGREREGEKEEAFDLHGSINLSTSTKKTKTKTAAPLSAAEEAALSRLIADANAALEPLQLAVKRVTLPEPAPVASRGGGEAAAANRGGGRGGGRAATNNGENDENEDGEENENAQQPRFDAAASIAGSQARSFYGVVNVEPDPVSLANGWGLSPALLAYLRAVVSFYFDLFGFFFFLFRSLLFRSPHLE